MSSLRNIYHSTTVYFYLTDRVDDQMSLRGCGRNVYNLVEDVSDLLDTPSKRTLWRYIVPLLTRSHQAFCQDVLGLPRHSADTGRAGSIYGYSSSRSNLPHRYGNSHAIRDHAVLPATRQSLTPAEAGTRLSDPGGMQG